MKQSSKINHWIKTTLAVARQEMIREVVGELLFFLNFKAVVIVTTQLNVHNAIIGEENSNSR